MTTQTDTASRWESLATHLQSTSEDICRLNDCAEDEHNCESYAYITDGAVLLDICSSDYFQGCSKPHAAIPLPWSGTGAELQEAVEEQAFNYYE